MSSYEIGRCVPGEFEYWEEERLQGDDLLGARGIYSFMLKYREQAYRMPGRIKNVTETSVGLHAVSFSLQHPQHGDNPPTIHTFLQDGIVKPPWACKIPVNIKVERPQRGYFQPRTGHEGHVDTDLRLSEADLEQFHNELNDSNALDFARRHDV